MKGGGRIGRKKAGKETVFISNVWTKGSKQIPDLVELTLCFGVFFRKLLILQGFGLRQTRLFIIF
jgi:hypothetical protein